MTPPSGSTVEAYLAEFPDDVRAIIDQARHAIRAALPEATERISYGIIRFDVAGRHAMYLGGWKDHLGIYPVPAAKGRLERELAPYRATKDTLQFPYAATVPLDLIGRAAALVAGES